jgi:dCMP deaminase
VSQKWDERFMQLASHFATWSKDPSTKVGAVIVDHDRRLVGTGYNGFPRGVGDEPERYVEKMVKYKLVVHAEANAIMNAVKSVRDCTLYATKYPCSECAKLIIQMGISRIIAPPPASDDSVWAEDSKFSTRMFREAVVSVYVWDGGKSVLSYSPMWNDRG